MKPSLLRTSFTLAAAIAALCGPVAAEDIDLFTSPPGVAIDNPNVIVFIDNSANWDAANQHWVSSGGGPFKQGQSELRALYNVTGELANGSLNMGLMFFTPGIGASPNGGYVRFHVRNMDATNKAALRELIGTQACVDGANSLNSTPNCIFNNFSSPNEKVGTAKSDYSGALFDVFKYLGGFTDPPNSKTNVGQTPVDATHFGPAR